MGLFRSKQPAFRSLTAAASAISTKATAAIGYGDDTASRLVTEQSTSRSWQEMCWYFYDAVGEIHQPATIVSNALSRVMLVAATVPDSDGADPQPLEDDDPNADLVREAVMALQSPTAGQSEIVRLLALNLFVVGECYLFGRELSNGEAEAAGLPPDSQAWEVLSTQEIQVQADGTPMRRRQPSSQLQPLPSGSFLARIWKRHPRYSDLPDCGLRAALDECELLMLLDRADRAAVRSRFTGRGVFFVPLEAAPASDPADAMTGYSDSPESPAEENPFFRDLIESMLAPITDEDSPAGVVPLTYFTPAEYIDSFRYMSFSQPLDERAEELRSSARLRIAEAIDMPAEMISTEATRGQWSDWLIHEDTFSLYLRPLAESICSGITAAYLRQALTSAGLPAEVAARYQVHYDDSRLVTHPDKSTNALRLYELAALSESAARREVGLDPEADAPSDEERIRRTGILLRDPTLATQGLPVALPPPLPPPSPATRTGDEDNPVPSAASPGTPTTARPAADEKRAPRGTVPATQRPGTPEAVNRSRQTRDSRLRTAGRGGPRPRTAR